MCTYFGEVLFIFNKFFLFWDIIDQDGVCAYFDKESSTKFLEKGEVLSQVWIKFKNQFLIPLWKGLPGWLLHFCIHFTLLLHFFKEGFPFVKHIHKPTVQPIIAPWATALVLIPLTLSGIAGASPMLAIKKMTGKCGKIGLPWTVTITWKYFNVL